MNCIFGVYLLQIGPFLYDEIFNPHVRLTAIKNLFKLHKISNLLKKKKSVRNTS